MPALQLFFYLLLEGQAWCSGESCLTQSPGCGFEAASPQILRGKGLSRFIPSLDPTHVGASGTGSALFLYMLSHEYIYFHYLNSLKLANQFIYMLLLLITRC